MTDQPEPAEDPSRTTATPFLLAVSIVVIVMIGMVLAAIISPADEQLTETDRLTASVSDFVRAHNNDDDEAVARMLCDTFAEDRSPIAGRDGEIEIVEVANARVVGHEATADVRIDAPDGKGETTESWQFVRGDNRWLVCN
ncbi:hypothetical protein [Prescottella sp. R16]|uniref:Rv0361 family membrane protein n=1 Tax=Prescottella sp. R16 TaxID=3064529 RepID=UPI00272E967A|nr:hypothetical protein [Prescottella sp. R16]